MKNPQSPFRICLTMAGAVSAGAYTAGVVDYLLETLELWNDAKSKNTKIKTEHPDDFLEHGYDVTIPMHDVIIDVISGASAGGITGTLTMLSALEGIKAVNRHNKEGKENKLYDSWVRMSDTVGESTLCKLLALDDITKSKKVESLLNSLPVEAIAENALNIKKVNKYPPYFSPDLDLILTVSNLSGLKYKIGFSGRDSDAGTLITNHSGFFRYRMKNKNNPAGIPKDGSLYFVLDMEKNKKVDSNNLKNATLSTAAFPIGLKPRENKVPKTYIDRYTDYLFGKDKCIKAIIPDEDPFTFLSVDGGLINNEPFGYALTVLKEKFPKIEAQKNYAMIMVDPFPNYSEEKEDERNNGFEKDIISIMKKTFQALRNQVMFKQDDIFNALNDNDTTRFLIAPSRKIFIGRQSKRVNNPLACGAIGGFSGFLDINFRKHDFLLGRQNCQSFLRYYFAIEKKELKNKLNADITEAAYNRYYFKRPPKGKDGIDFFPIIPDLKIKQAFDNQYHKITFGEDAEINYPKFPSISIETIKREYEDLFKGRIGKIITWFLPKKRHRLIACILNIKGKIFTRLIKEIEAELKKHGLLD